MKIKKKVLKRSAVYLVITVATLISIFPFYWIICGSTNKSVEFLRGRLLPGGYFMDNLHKLMETYDVFRIILNTAIVTVCTCVLSLLICSLAAYAFAKYEFKGKNVIFGALMLSMMVPFSAIMIPMFRLAVKFEMINTLAGIVLPSIVPVFLLFFFRQSFCTFPTEIIEAARIDGSGEVRILRSIVLPATKATFAAGIIWSFMSSWNNYLWPLLIIQSDEKKTLSLLLSSMGASYRNIDYGSMMLAIIIATAPIVVIYFTMQKQFVAGIVGATKG